MHKYRKKNVLYLIIFLILFLIAFFVTYFSFKSGKSVLNLGFPYEIEDYVIMVLSIIGMVMIIYEIIKIEHHNDFENRIKKIS